MLTVAVVCVLAGCNGGDDKSRASKAKVATAPVAPAPIELLRNNTLVRAPNFGVEFDVPAGWHVSTSTAVQNSQTQLKSGEKLAHLLQSAEARRTMQLSMTKTRLQDSDGPVTTLQIQRRNVRLPMTVMARCRAVTHAGLTLLADAKETIPPRAVAIGKLPAATCGLSYKLTDSEGRHWRVHTRSLIFVSGDRVLTLAVSAPSRQRAYLSRILDTARSFR